MMKKQTTKKRLLDATRKLLAEKGFQSIGINSIAREAGLDKVLIYRNFGGLPELLNELALNSDFWPTVEEMAGCPLEEIKHFDIKKLTAHLLKGRARELKKRPATQEIMRWELIERNKLTDQLHFARERLGDELNNLIPLSNEKIGNIDVPAVSALIIAGVTYLVLRSKTADTFNGIDLHSEEGWERIDKAIDAIVNMFYEHVITDINKKG